MSVNTPASWSACSEDAAGDAVWACSLARVYTFKCFAQVSVVGRISGIVLSSKRAKKLFSLSGSKTSVLATGMVFIL